MSKRLFFLAALFATLSVTSALAGDKKWADAVAPEPVRVSSIDTTASWYHPDRVYYEKLHDYTIGDFFNAIDLPTVFGLGFNPTGNEKGVGYYSQMFLEWRPYKTYGWFVAAGLDSHNQSYNWGSTSKHPYSFPTDWTPATGVWVFGKDNAGNKLTNPDVNVVSGTVYNMELVVGPGYRVPLVKDIRSYYEHPYVNKLNLALSAQFGYAWSNLNNITVDSGSGLYEINNVNYIHPVMKFGAMLEWFTGQKFSIFLMASYMQHLTTMPWDNPTTKAGTLAFSIGFAGFFN